jgi:hypothetical protein
MVSLLLMPYAITRETNGVYVKWSGKITGDDFLKSVHEVNMSPDFNLYRYVINDTVGCSGIDLPARAKEESIAGAIGAHASNPRFAAAFVATDPAITDVWTSVANVANDFLKTAVFADLATARHWALTVARD